jgi:aldehyde dehydrogenase (NAD+)
MIAKLPVETQQIDIPQLIRRQREYFATGETRSIEFRLTQLRRLQESIVANQDRIVAAVAADLGRAPFEAYFEIAILAEIKLIQKKLKEWMKPRRIKTQIDAFPAQAWVQPEPLGVALIIGPWNYPFQLLIWPLVGAIAAGNCAILKPSEYASATSALVARMMGDLFDSQYVAVLEGDVAVSQALLAEKFDRIFFTGGTAVGKIVMAAAAKHLTPVTLELGGKSPCIVDDRVRLDTTAKRIVWGKFLNSGQTCIAPDYIFVPRDRRDELVANLCRYVREFYGENPQTSPDYARIVNQKQLTRLKPLLQNGKIAIGGEWDDDDRYLAPTIVTDIGWEDPIMEDEIFGPILPVLTYDRLDEAISAIASRPKPLALYLFSEDEGIQQRVLQQISSGGVCINDTVMQVGISGLPFGGVGESGMGSYHGKDTFDTFSHYRSVLKRGLWLDLDWRYAPYTDRRVAQIKRIVTGK